MIQGRISVVISVVCIVLLGSITPSVAVAPSDTVADSQEPPPDSRLAAGTASSGTVTADIAPELFHQNGTVSVLVELQRANTAMGTDFESTRSVLRRHAFESQQSVISFARTHPAAVQVERQLWLSNVVLLSVNTTMVDLRTIARLDGVERLAPNEKLRTPRPQPTSPRSRSPDVSPSNSPNTTFGLQQVNAPAVWSEYDTRGKDVSVAVLDSGVAVDHPDIDLHTTNESDPTYPGGWAEFTATGGQVSDSQPRAVCGDHGTHTSGTVAGSNASGEWIGVAPDVSLLHGAVLTDATGYGCGGTTVQVIAGMQWAVNNSADVISMSLGGPADGQFIDPVRNAQAAGTVVVAASGNGGAETTGSPGAVYEAVAVGSTTEDRRIATSSGGKHVQTNTTYPEAPESWPGSYVVPDVVAPGVDVKSSVPGSDYTEHSGTSMATPHVAGVIALMKSRAGDDVSPGTIKNALYETASKPARCSPSCTPRDGNDTRYGAGIVDAYAAVSALEPEPAYDIGDVNEDGSVTVRDVHRLQQYLSGSLPESATFNPQLADLDGDGRVTRADLRLLRRSVLGINLQEP